MTYEYNSYLAHHGVKGQKWGVRRYQNEDGTLTEQGKKKYDSISTYDAIAEGHAKRAGDAKGLKRGYHASKYAEYSRKRDNLLKEAGFKNLSEITRAKAVTNVVERIAATNGKLPSDYAEKNWKYIRTGKT